MTWIEIANMNKQNDDDDFHFYSPGGVVISYVCSTGKSGLPSLLITLISEQFLNITITSPGEQEWNSAIAQRKCFIYCWFHDFSIK